MNKQVMEFPCPGQEEVQSGLLKQDTLEKKKAHGWDLFGFDNLISYLLGLVPGVKNALAKARVTQSMVNEINQDFITKLANLLKNTRNGVNTTESIEIQRNRIAENETKKQNLMRKFGLNDEDMVMSATSMFAGTALLIMLLSTGIDIIASATILSELYSGAIVLFGANIIVAAGTTLLAGYAGKLIAVSKRINRTINLLNKRILQIKSNSGSKSRPGERALDRILRSTTVLPGPDLWLQPEDPTAGGAPALLQSKYGTIEQLEDGTYEYKLGVWLFLGIFCSLFFVSIFTVTKIFLIDFSGAYLLPLIMYSAVILVNFGYTWLESGNYSGLPLNIQRLINKVLSEKDRMIKRLETLEHRKEREAEQNAGIESKKKELFSLYEKEIAQLKKNAQTGDNLEAKQLVEDFNAVRAEIIRRAKLYGEELERIDPSITSASIVEFVVADLPAEFSLNEEPEITSAQIDELSLTEAEMSLKAEVANKSNKKGRK